MLLEIATTVGALTGAYLSKILQPEALSIVFGFVLLFSAYLSLRSRRQHSEHGESRSAGGAAATGQHLSNPRGAAALSCASAYRWVSG